MSDISLCEAEERDAIVKSLIYIFQQVQNKPSYAHSLVPIYIELKDGIQQRKEGSRDQCSGIRSCFSVWNRLARKYKLGKHESGKDGCLDSDFHRICKKKNPNELTKYWINQTLANVLHKRPVEACKRSKVLKNIKV